MPRKQNETQPETTTTPPTTTATTQPFYRLLSRVCLGGVINECVLSVKNGRACIQAVDLSGTLYVEVDEDIDTADMSIGLGDLRMLTRFMEGDGGSEFRFTLSDHWATFSRQGHGQIRTQTMDPGQVATAVAPSANSAAPNAKRLLKGCSANISPEPAAIERFLYYTSLVKSNSVVFRIHKNRLSIMSPQTESTQYMLEAGRLDNSTEDFSIEVYSAPLVAVFNATAGDKSMLINIGAGNPIVITVDGALWAATPILNG